MNFNIFTFFSHKSALQIASLLETGCLSGLEIKLIHDEGGPFSGDSAGNRTEIYPARC